MFKQEPACAPPNNRARSFPGIVVTAGPTKNMETLRL
jgi:hypothetical protein